MRGYGISGGYQNIVITVDGRRMNNIDMSPQLLSSIPLKSIDRIEITKGSGSILYGDGAMAGSIQIYTKDAPTNQLSLLVGNHGKKVGSFSTGLSEAHFQLLVSADHSALDGFSEADSSGEPDESDSNSSRIQLRLFPTEETELSIEKEHAMINTRYIGHLTEGEFNDNPAQNSGNLYTPEKFETDVVTLGLTTTLSNHLDLSLRHSQEDKYSNFLNGWGRAEY